MAYQVTLGTWTHPSMECNFFVTILADQFGIIFHSSAPSGDQASLGRQADDRGARVRDRVPDCGRAAHGGRLLVDQRRHQAQVAEEPGKTQSNVFFFLGLETWQKGFNSVRLWALRTLWKHVARLLPVCWALRRTDGGTYLLSRMIINTEGKTKKKNQTHFF